MKKLCFLLSVMILLLSACSLKGSHFMERFIDNDTQIANQTLEQILDAIKERDKEALTELFSVNTLVEANDFDTVTDELFEFFQGEVVSYSSFAGGPGVDEMRDRDIGRWKKMISTYDVITSEGKYRFAIEEFTVDTTDPNNIGVHSLYVISAKDSDQQYAYWGDGNWSPGIIIE